jgi:hypothetical protein
MDSLRNDIYDLFVNAHARNKIYWQFDHGIIYIANEGRYARISEKFTIYRGLVLYLLCSVDVVCKNAGDKHRSFLFYVLFCR